MGRRWLRVWVPRMVVVVVEAALSVAVAEP